MLKTNVSNLSFFDARPTQQGSLTLGNLNSTYFNGNTGTIAQFIQAFANKAAVSLSYKGVQAPNGTIILPDVLLTQTFFSDSTADQNFVLIHELLHYTLQMDDQQILKAFDIDPGLPGDPLTTWLEQGCSNQPKKRDD